MAFPRAEDPGSGYPLYLFLPLAAKGCRCYP